MGKGLDFRGPVLDRKMQQAQDTTVGCGHPVRWRGRFLRFFPRIVSALQVADDFGLVEAEFPSVLTGEALEVELAREPIEALLFDPGKIPGGDSRLLRNPTKPEVSFPRANPLGTSLGTGEPWATSPSRSPSRVGYGGGPRMT